MPRETKIGATRDSYVFRVRVPDELRTQWEEHCTKENRKPAATIRLLMRYMVKGDIPEAVQAWLAEQTLEPDHAAKQRVEVRLTRSEYQAAQARAEAEGTGLQRYIVNCVRASLTNEPQMTMQAANVLHESNIQLRAIGRNLNQIAKAVNGGAAFNATEAQLKKLADYIQRHADKQSDVMDASLGRWKLKTP